GNHWYSAAGAETLRKAAQEPWTFEANSSFPGVSMRTLGKENGVTTK
ncbi:MAG: hypothetical protein JWN34_4070, partial [Bryobacterales bacterium]|nr:hypothetical protein [Bryobacterales bacterium]